MFDELVARTDALLRDKPHVIIAISGFAGAGKTTLASKLAEHYDIADAQILRLDNMYTPMPRGTGLFDDYDSGLVASILHDVHDSKDLHYQTHGFEEDSVLIDQPLPVVVILEGIRLFRPEMMSQFDLGVWIDCPPQLALERAKARDLVQGHDEAYMQRWDIEWGPQNEAYYSDYHPEQLASFLYQQYQ